LLSEARPEMTLFLAVTARQQTVAQKIKNFFTKWRQVQQKIPLPEMTELHITTQLPAYPKIAHDVFMLLLDGKLRSRTEIQKFLKPLAPPPPPPPPPPSKRKRGAKAAAAAPPASQVATAGKKPKAVASAAGTEPSSSSGDAAVGGKKAAPPKAQKQAQPKKTPKAAGKKARSG
jgi:tRNA nucleotidyltransferase (CCA-adding enzyme)